MPLVRTAFRAMASDNALQVYAADASRANEATAAAIADIHRIEAKYSRYRDDSVTSRINAAAGGAEVAIDAETAALLGYADRCFAQSDGLFDVTSGVLRRVWNFGAASPRLPGDAALEAALALVGWIDVEWSERTVRLPRAGMEIDFGGIGKEYAADRAAAILEGRGIVHALINLGGDVRALGPQPAGTPWRIGIRHPRRPGAAVAAVELDAGAVATSGDYERYLEVDGRRYCHILNPRTGMPAAYWQSVSVVAPLCVVAGSCATIAMLREATAEAFLQAQGYRFVVVAPDGSVRGPGMVAPRPEASCKESPPAPRTDNG
jgi:thiamine biosynthesis lipoprotein